MLVLALGILLSFAGTGLMLMVVCAPLLLWRLPLKILPAILIVGLIILLAAAKVGWYDQVHRRITEYQSTGSSAHERFIAPANMLVDFLSNPETILTGNGPGNVDKQGGNGSPWPIVKVTYEYGIVTSVLFVIFLCYCVFKAPPNRVVAFALLLFYNFLGAGFATPVYAFSLLIFSTMFLVSPEKARVPLAAKAAATRRRRPLPA